MGLLKNRIEKMLNKFDRSNLKDVSNLLMNYFKISLECCPMIDAEVQYMSQVLYGNVIDCLMYDMICNRLNLT